MGCFMVQITPLCNGLIEKSRVPSWHDRCVVDLESTNAGTPHVVCHRERALVAGGVERRRYHLQRAERSKAAGLNVGVES